MKDTQERKFNSNIPRKNLTKRLCPFSPERNILGKMGTTQAVTGVRGGEGGGVYIEMAQSLSSKKHITRINTCVFLPISNSYRPFPSCLLVFLKYMNIQRTVEDNYFVTWNSINVAFVITYERRVPNRSQILYDKNFTSCNYVSFTGVDKRSVG